MGNKILDIIASETNGKSYKTYKYCFDSAETSPIDYDDNKQITWKKYGETVPPKQAKDMREDISGLLFSFTSTASQFGLDAFQADESKMLVGNFKREVVEELLDSILKNGYCIWKVSLKTLR